MKALLLASIMLVFAAAAQAQTITPSHGTLTDAAGNVWTITQSGSIKEGSRYTPGGGGTSALTIVNGTVYGEDSSGRGWFALSGSGQYWISTPAPAGITATRQQTAPGNQATTTSQTAPTDQAQDPGTSTTTTPSQGPSTQTVAVPPPSCGRATARQFGILPLTQSGTGQIIDSVGNVFVPRGIDVMYGNGNPSAATLKSLFPGINFVRLAIYQYKQRAGPGLVRQRPHIQRHRCRTGEPEQCRPQCRRQPGHDLHQPGADN